MKLILAILFASLSLANATQYFIDFAGGNDANNGTSKLTPWRRAPQMNGFGGTYVHVAGDHFIFKGGTLFTMQSMTNGAGQQGHWTIQQSGATNNYDYFGVDKTWFNGPSWSYPVIDGQGQNFNGCTESNNGFNVMVQLLNGVSHIYFDSIRFTNLRLPGGITSYGHVEFILHDMNQSDIVFANCSLDTVVRSPSAIAGVLAYYKGSDDPATTRDVGCYLTNCIIDGVTAANQANGQCTGTGVYLYGGKLINCKFRNVCNSGVMGTAVNGWAEIIGCEIGPILVSWTSGEHDNALRISRGGGPWLIHGNYIHDSQSAMLFWGDSGETEWLYDNILDNPIASPVITVDPNGVSGGQTYAWNNTIQANGQPIFRVPPRGGTFSYGVASAINNHYIQPGLIFDTTTTLINNKTNLSSVSMSASQAFALGYQKGNLYAPTALTSPTVDVGQALSPTIPALDYLGVSRPQFTAWDVGAYEFASSSPGTITMSVSAQSALEGGGPTSITAIRSGGVTGQVTATMVTVDGTATAGHDYTAVTNTFVWADGATGARTAQVPILNSGDTALTNRTFTAYLTNPTGSATLGAPSNTVVTIIMTPPPVRFVQTVTSIAPSAGVQIVVNPPDVNALSDGPTSFARTYAQGTSVTLTAPPLIGGNTFVKWQKDGVDFTASTNAMFTADAAHTWTAVYVTPAVTIFQLTVSSSPPGAVVSVSPADVNANSSGVAPFSRQYNSGTTVSLGAPSGGFVKWQQDGSDFAFTPATAVSMSSAHTLVAFYAVTNGGTIALSAPSYTTCETCTNMTFSVVRTSGTNQPVTVNFTTADGTARAGTDYTSTNGVLSWIGNQNTSQPVTVPILNPVTFGNPKTFAIALTTPTGGAVLGLSFALVSITQNATLNVSVTNTINGNITVTGNLTIQGK